MSGHCGCKAPKPGASMLCARHGVLKTALLWEKCQERGLFWDRWEAGTGPGQTGQRATGSVTATTQAPPMKKQTNLERKRRAICAECVHRISEDRCKHVDLGCRATYRNTVRSPYGKCPIGSWGAERTQANGYSIKSERRKICHGCSDATLRGCLQIRNGKPDAYAIALNADKPTCPRGKWKAQWQEVADSIPEPTRDRLVITIAIGDHFQELLAITGPRLRAYAELCNADYVELTNGTQNWWGLEKFRLYEFAKRYERTLFIDADVIVTSAATSLFDLVPHECVAFHDDFPYMPNKDWYARERSVVANDQHIDTCEPGTAWNTGVVMCNRDSADIWKPPPHAFLPTHCYEQIWIELLAKQYPFYELAAGWNCQYWFREFWKLARTAPMVHLSACDKGARKQIAEAVAQW